WGEGFPGWHLECSAMSRKYLGESFDIHGGGMDLIFPHHECEIAQSTARHGSETVRYWMHNNMITINGQKMARSLGNFITLDQLFSGNHELLQKEWSPMTIRFFILQAHYRSTIDFSNDALLASEKGLERLMNAIDAIDELPVSKTSTIDVSGIKEKCFHALNDDLNTPIALAHLFDGARIINSIKDGKESISEADKNNLKQLYHEIVYQILGLRKETSEASNEDNILHEVIDLMLNLRHEAKARKDWETADRIRTELNNLGVEIKDTPTGFEWKIKSISSDIHPSEKMGDKKNK
ncbi:MAG TPA: DALR domain-containing protein, partial [Mariniphaga sp.]|nr:DALR domain-containing protein [Mariniphaga sp.]